MSNTTDRRLPDLKAAHELCTRNEDCLRASEKAGCFYCCRVYPAADVKEWIRENRGVRTALCPRCGIDAVIGDQTGLALTDEFLNAMYVHWFDTDVEVDDEV